MLDLMPQGRKGRVTRGMKKQRALSQVKSDCCDLQSLQLDERGALARVLHRGVLYLDWKRP